MNTNPDFSEMLRDCLSCGVLVIDDQGVVTNANEEARRILGVQSEAVVALTVGQLPAELRTAVEQARTASKPLSQKQVFLGNPTVPPAAPCLLNVLPLPGSGPVAGVVCVLQDLAPARNLDQAIRWLERLGSTGILSATMAHEVKNALVAIKTYFEMAQGNQHDPTLAAVASKEIRRIDALISQMLRFASPAKASPTAIQVAELLEHALRVVQQQIEAKSIKVTQVLSDEKITILGDINQLEQAFINLFLNALEAMERGGELEVTTRISPPSSSNSDQVPRQVQVTIRDTGVGIAPENLLRMFEPFFTTKPHGTGLGLVITRRIIEEHKGSITAESAPGRGTTFQINLPVLPV